LITNRTFFSWAVCVLSKQWPLASKFCECEFCECCEYSRKYSRTRLRCVSCWCCDSPSRVARTRQTRERQVWRVLCEFGESGKFGECRLDRFMHIKDVICAKNDLSYHARLRRHSPSRVARTRQTRRHSPSRVAWTQQTCWHSPSRVARTRQTHRHSPKAIFEKNVTRLHKFVRVTRESCKFGASGHSLVLSPTVKRF
jgi:hypothetical protein